jgi:formylglycine-generating enzyme required for sulfatase activity
LFFVGVAGIGGAYMLGLFGKINKPPANIANTASPTPAGSPAAATKVDMALIPGGTFTMGRNDGRDNEQPEHAVTLKPFWMDKTEVTNAEYAEFTQATGHKPVPAHWVNDRPIAGQEQVPVRFVSLDDAMAFADWRSKRDGVTYRLPTEEEWEYAARNGAKENLYPWGDKFDNKCAVMDEPSHEPKAVNTKSCPDDWGVHDLIGNVFEWTSSPVSLYPGSKGVIKPLGEPYYMVRGGSAFYKSSGPLAITSSFRQEVPAKKTLAELGFRLVRSQQ